MSDTFEDMVRRIQSGSISQASLAELRKFSEALCWSQAYSHFGAQQFVQVCETVRLLLLQKHIEAIEAKSSRYQWLVVALAVASLVSSIVQVAVAL